jgi:hypothetical protein
MPALAAPSKRFAVADAKVSKVTADPAGGTTTYASSVDVPGIKSVTLSIEVNEKELRGDNKLLDADVTYAKATGTFNYAKSSHDLHAVLLGATKTDSGTTPNQISKLALKGSDRPNYFKFEAATPSGGADPSGIVAGDAHLVLYKAKITGFGGFGLAEEDYNTFSVPFVAFARLSDDAWIDDVLNETAVVIT